MDTIMDDQVKFPLGMELVLLWNEWNEMNEMKWNEMNKAKFGCYIRMKILYVVGGVLT